MRDEVGYARLYVYHEVRQFHERHHEVEEVRIVVKVSVAHVPLRMQVRGKDACILKYRAVLYYCVFTLGDFHNFLETLVQEIYLQIERPPLHVMIEIFKIRIVVYWFKTRNPIVSFCQHLGERRFSAPDIAGNCYVHDVCLFFLVLLAKLRYGRWLYRTAVTAAVSASYAKS